MNRLCRIALISRAFFSAALTLLLVASASGMTIRDDRPDAEHLALAGATALAPVGKISGTFSDGNAFLASGTLIGDRYVLTAAHVVDNASALSFRVGGAEYAGLDWGTHPQWHGNLIAGNDLGILELAGPVAGVAPATLYTGAKPVAEMLTAVGFGLTGTGSTGATIQDERKRAGTNHVEFAFGDVLAMDFDDPAVEHGWLEQIAESFFPHFAETDLESLIAPGDSGGGLFVNNAGQLELAGVNSFLVGFDGTYDADYGDWAGGVALASHNAWIQDVLAGVAPLEVAYSSSAAGVVNGRVVATSSVVPEPASMALAAMGLALLWRRRR